MADGARLPSEHFDSTPLLTVDRVPYSPLESTPVVETFWRRLAHQGSVSLASQCVAATVIHSAGHRFLPLLGMIHRSILRFGSGRSVATFICQPFSAIDGLKPLEEL